MMMEQRNALTAEAQDRAPRTVPIFRGFGNLPENGAFLRLGAGAEVGVGLDVRARAQSPLNAPNRSALESRPTRE